MALSLYRRIHQGYFRDDRPKVISALGYLWEQGKIKVYLRVKSLPGDNPNPPGGPILDPTAHLRVDVAAAAAAAAENARADM